MMKFINKISAFFLAFTVIFASCYTVSAETVEDSYEITSLYGKKVMFIGNSHFYYGNCVNFGSRDKGDKGYFYRIANLNGEDCTVTDRCYSGMKLKEIYETYLIDENADFYKKFDYVFLSEAAQKNKELISDVEDIMSLFPKTTEFIFLPAPYLYVADISSVISSLDDLTSLGVKVVNIGELIYNIIDGTTAVPGSKCIYNYESFFKNNEGYKNGKGHISEGADGDSKHPNLLTGYLTALTAYTAVTGRSAVGQPYDFCDDTVLHKNYTFDGYISAHYNGKYTTDFPEIFASPDDMKGLQSLVNTICEEAGIHPMKYTPYLAPTCDEAGHTEGLECAVCGHEAKKLSKINPLGGEHITGVIHGYENTCTTAGKTDEIYCIRCKKVFTPAKIIEASGHNETIVKGKAPTCTKDGLTDGTKCKTCGKTIKKQEIISKTGHKYKIIGKVSATYFKTGSTGTKICIYCGKTVYKYKTTEKKVLKTPKVTLKASKGKITVKITKVTDMKGVRIKYKKYGSSKWKYITLSSKKSVTKIIKNLKKGKYYVKVRAFVNSGSKKAYSKYTSAKTAKVK